MNQTQIQENHYFTDPIKIVTWNIGGVEFLRTLPIDRMRKKEIINKEIMHIINRYDTPHFIVLQEIVKYQQDSEIEELIEVPESYYYKSSIAIDTKNQNNPQKWDKIRNDGKWEKKEYLGQGNGILWKKDIPHASIWETNISKARSSARLEIEEVRIDTGLYIGNRDSEPRIAGVAHFILNNRDIFLINVHLTTLTGERGGLPERDEAGSKTRLQQLDIILNGIVSRHNQWTMNINDENQSTKEPAIWFLAGDFNAKPNSPEMIKMERLNFFDLSPEKGDGTKRSKKGVKAELTVDYIFAGPMYFSFDPNELKNKLLKKDPLYEVVSSDHYPIGAHFYI